MVAERSVNQRR